MRSWVGDRGAGRRRRRVSAQSRCRGAGRRRRRASRGVAFVRTDISHFTHTHSCSTQVLVFPLGPRARHSLSLKPRSRNKSLATSSERRISSLPSLSSYAARIPAPPLAAIALSLPPVKIRLACAASLPYSATPPLSALVQTLTLRRLLISHQLSSHQFLFFT